MRRACEWFSGCALYMAFSILDSGVIGHSMNVTACSSCLALHLAPCFGRCIVLYDWGTDN